jgi:hypothetical protein
MSNPLDLYHAKYAGRLQFLYGAVPLDDARTLVAIARDVESGVLSVHELRDAIGDKPMSLDEMLHDASKDCANPNHRALVVFHSQANLSTAVERFRGTYTALGAVWKWSQRRWVFESGAAIEFGVVEKEGDEHKFAGMAWNWLGLHHSDTLSKTQFATLVSRVRPQEGTTRIIRW